VLITAGAQGIGRATALAFVAEGARVHVCDVDDAALQALASEAPAIGTTLADVSDEGAVARMFADVEAALGGLDVLVNNAGISGPTAPVEEVSLDEWNRTFAVNVAGQFLCARAAIPLLRAATDGAIVNLSSLAGKHGYPFRSPYAASKWAVVGFTATLAKELGPAGIRVNAVLPGAVEGERIRSVIAARAETTGRSVEEMTAKYTHMVSLGRFIPPEEIAELIVYLCSPAARNISGQAISIDGNSWGL
jgi:NAD(P)-dependent dehydrogenase (short-subunit alcohol dehydrogenase family)